MDSMHLIGCNTKYYRFQKNLTQEKFAEMTGFKMAYLSTIENGEANLTCKTIGILISVASIFAKKLEIKTVELFNEETAKKAKNLPNRVDKYYKNLKK